MSLNKAAHQANAVGDLNSTAPVITNGVHHPATPPTDPEPPSDLLPPQADLVDPAQPSVDQSTPPTQPLNNEANNVDVTRLDVEQIEESAPIVQQPISDLREGSHAVSHNMDSLSSVADTSLDMTEPSQPTTLDSMQVESTGADVGTGSRTALETQKQENDGATSLADEVTSPPESNIQKGHSEISPTENTQPQVSSGGIPSQDNNTGPPTPEVNQAMQDEPASSTKVGRTRDDDDTEDGPAAKRAKTEQVDASGEDFKIPQRPQIDTQSITDAPPSQMEPSPMTKPRLKHLQKALGNVKRIQAAKPFLAPVDPIALKIPTYLDVVKKPMDLRTLEDNLRADKYPTVDAFLSDFALILQNARTFNGPDHVVTKNAVSMQENFDKHVTTLPGPEITDTVPSKKKAPDPMTIRAPPIRRESRSSLPGSARSPASASSPQTFALGPEGMPLIRRDSTIDGRPKREIHKPAPRDLPYTHQKPKKKKFVWELKFCDHVLKELAKPKFSAFAFPFMVPVDPVALNIPNYLSIVKKPMDFGTVRQKLDRGEYENAKDFEADARLVFKNCFLFNPESDNVHQLGKRLESVFNEEWSKKREWLEENTPSSGQRSPASSEDEESEEEEEVEEEDDGQMEIVSKLQKQIAEMSKQVEMITSGAKKKTPPAPTKKASKPAKPAKKDVKKTTQAVPKPEKKVASKPARKERIPYVTYEQKQDISNRINSLSESKMSHALSIIRNNMPNLKGVQEDELELDIDELSNEVLYKLLQFVRKHAPRPEDSPMIAATAASAAPGRKKNKPMSKSEQEARIAQVQSGLSAFQKGGAGSLCMCPSVSSSVPMLTSI